MKINLIAIATVVLAATTLTCSEGEFDWWLPRLSFQRVVTPQTKKPEPQITKPVPVIKNSKKKFSPRKSGPCPKIDEEECISIRERDCGQRYKELEEERARIDAEIVRKAATNPLLQKYLERELLWTQLMESMDRQLKAIEARTEQLKRIRNK